MKRIVLFLATNLAVMLVLGVIIHLLGLNRWLSAEGINYEMLLALSALIGFGGSIFSLLISKPVAKWSTGAKVIDGSEGSTEYWLVQTVHRLADKAGIGHPEVAVYEGEPNAFATGAFRNDSLVAVSTGLMQGMDRQQVEAVLGHEISHVANGDMVTLTLIQGVVNTFVVFLSKIVGFFVDRVVLKNDRGFGIGFFITEIVCQIVFGLLASMIVAWFSRQREFRADAGSADLLGKQPMISALNRLGQMHSEDLPQSVKAFGINGGGSSFGALFATHPPIEQRIAALQSRG